MPDINVWLALSFSGHPHHQAALFWFNQQNARNCVFCRMTQQGYLRLSTNTKIFASDALSLPEAWDAYDLLLSDSRVFWQGEPAAIEGEWRKLTSDEFFPVKIWNDAFLAAFAKTASLQLVTFDKGFRRYSGLDFKLLN
ncbi:MAG: PIN domain-containing protein [Verrucomicrobiota bacterium]